MKRMSAFFPIMCIFLLVAGASGLVMDFLIALEKMKDADCPRFLAVLIILMGLAWAVIAVITAIRGYKDAKQMLSQQRKRREGRGPNTRLNGRQFGARALLIIAICAVQIIFALLIGLKTWQLLYYLIAGMIIPYLFMISSKANLL